MNKFVKHNAPIRPFAFSLEHHVPNGPVLKQLHRAWVVLKVSLLFTLLAGGLPARGAVNVWLYHNHLSRDGLYISPVFTNSVVAGLTLDTTFNGTVAGNVYAQPLYIEGGPGGRAVVIAATETGDVYALDAFAGTVVWHTNLASPVVSGNQNCGNIFPSGITGTPVVDLPSRTLFLNAITFSSLSSTVKHLIYSLNVDTGLLNPGWPLSVNSNAVSGAIVFDSLDQGERGALTIIGSTLYVPYGGLDGDCGTYHGWVVGVPLNDPSTVMAWATTAPGGGAWAVGGIASDGVEPFVATGNTFTASPHPWGGGEAILHLTPSLVLSNGTANYWSPTNWLSLDNSDTDLGGSGPILVDVPGATPSNLVVALGKDGNMYLLNRTNLGGISAPVAKATVAGGAIIQAAATYQTTNGTYVVFANGGNLNSYRIGASSPPTITKAWSGYEGGNGSPFVTSTDGSNSVIVWGVGAGAGGSQKLYAFNGETGATLFNSTTTIAGASEFITGIVARNRLYVAGANKIYSFSLPEPKPAAITISNPTVTPAGAFQLSFTNSPGVLFNVFATTNLAQPTTNWTWVDSATEVSLGQYQFTDTQTPANSDRFYQVVGP
jgi:hypothetical protein